MNKDKVISIQEPCPKCLKKHGQDLTNWEPCKNCPWITKAEDDPSKKFKSNEKICIECTEALNFLEPEPQKYLCGKNKCLRSYIERKSEKKE